MSALKKFRIYRDRLSGAAEAEPEPLNRKLQGRWSREAAEDLAALLKIDLNVEVTIRKPPEMSRIEKYREYRAKLDEEATKLGEVQSDMVGYKGSGFVSTGFVYAPYIPVTTL